MTKQNDKADMVQQKLAEIQKASAALTTPNTEMEWHRNNDKPGYIEIHIPNTGGGFQGRRR